MQYWLMLALHILAGLLGIASGATALMAAKGAQLHVRVGLIFVGSMLVMASSGVVLAIVRPNTFSTLNGIAATLTFYLVLTGFLTIRRATSSSRRTDAATALVALAIAGTSVSLGMASNHQSGPPAPAYFMFGALATLASAGDVRKALRGIRGSRLVARHLWRLGAAMWIATSSFFLGQARVFPEAIRKPALLAVPVLMVFLAVLYWFLKVRFTSRFSNHSPWRRIPAVANTNSAGGEEPSASRSR